MRPRAGVLYHLWRRGPPKAVPYVGQGCANNALLQDTTAYSIYNLLPATNYLLLTYYY